MEPKLTQKPKSSIKNYNTEAYLPNQDPTCSVERSPVEAPQASSQPQPQPLSYGSTNTKTPTEPLNGLKTQNAVGKEAVGYNKTINLEGDSRQNAAENKPSKKSSKLMVGIVIVLILALLLGGGYLLWQHFGRNDNSAPQGADNQDGLPQDADNQDDSKIEEIAVDSELAQKIYKRFKDVNLDMPFLYEEDGKVDFSMPYSKGFYGSEGAVKNGINQKEKLAIALSNTEVRADRCEVDARDVGLLSYLGGGEKESAYCRRGIDVKDAYRDIFGEEVALQEGIFTLGASGLYYGVHSDGFFFVASRGGNRGYIKELYKAESDGVNLYLYEIVATIFHCEEGLSPCYIADADGNEIVGIEHPTSLVTDREEVLRYMDRLDKFKWTFTKTTKGNYVFDKLEKIEE